MTVKTNLKVSIIIPCRNEEKHISKCLDSIIDNDFDKNKIEILLIDGMSEDKTREIINQYAKKYPFIKIYENKNNFTPFALNIAIKNAKGEIIIRMDAHATYERKYISKCIKYLDEYGADDIGGIWKIIPQKNTFIGNVISLTQSNFFGVGNASYRFATGKPIWVDTVPYFCVRKEIFKRIGLFNENLIRGQDMEFNLRLKKAGGKILLVPDIISYYYVRSDLKSFIGHSFKNGVWAILPLKFTKIMPVSLRHLIPLFFVSTILLTLVISYFLPFAVTVLFLTIIFYFLCAALFSINTLFNKGLMYFLFLPIIFFLLHFSYGLGSVWGIVNLFNKKK